MPSTTPSTAAGNGHSPSPSAVKLASTIRHARLARGLTQRELAKHLGVTQSAVGQWEVARTAPSRDHLPAISETLGIPLRTLLDAHGGDVTFSPDVARLALKVTMLTEGERAAIEAAVEGMLSYRRESGSQTMS